MSNSAVRKFEEEMADLEAVVAQIDSGELSLEDSIAAFERGVGLVRTLNQKLDDVEQRVEVLTRRPDGELKLTPFQLVEGASAARGAAPEDDDIPF